MCTTHVHVCSRHRRRLWQDIQRQVALFLDSIELSALTLPQYLQLLGHVKRLVSIGEDFVSSGEDSGPGETSTIVTKSIRTNSLEYITTMHRDILGKVKASLTGDTWVALSVVRDFNIYFLKEFAFLRQRSTTTTSALSTAAPTDEGSIGGMGATLRAYRNDHTLFQRGACAVECVWDYDGHCDYPEGIFLTPLLLQSRGFVSFLPLARGICIAVHENIASSIVFHVYPKRFQPKPLCDRLHAQISAVDKSMRSR